MPDSAMLIRGRLEGMAHPAPTAPPGESGLNYTSGSLYVYLKWFTRGMLPGDFMQIRLQLSGLSDIKGCKIKGDTLLKRDSERGCCCL